MERRGSVEQQSGTDSDLAPLISESAIQRRRRSISELEERLHSRSNSVHSGGDQHDFDDDLQSGIKEQNIEDEEIHSHHSNHSKRKPGREMNVDLGGAQIHLHRSGSLVLHVEAPSGSDSENSGDELEANSQSAIEGMTELDDYLKSQGVDPLAIVEDAKKGAESPQPRRVSPTNMKPETVRQETVVHSEGTNEHTFGYRESAYNKKQTDAHTSFAKESNHIVNEESPSDLEERLQRLENMLKSEMSLVEEHSQFSQHSPHQVSHRSLDQQSPQQPSSKLDFSSPIGGSPFASKPKNSPNVDDFNSWQQRTHLAPETYANHQGEWEELNHLLEKNGFNPIPLFHSTAEHSLDQQAKPELRSIIPVIRSVLAEYQRRPRSDIDAQEKEWEALRKLSHAEERARKLQRELDISEQKARELEEDLSTQSRSRSSKTRQLEQENTTLKQRVAHSEHRVKAKEALLERMQEKLDEEIQRQSLHKARDRELFKELHRRAPVPSSRNDQESIKAIGAFENEREKLLSEIDFLRVENRQLSDKMRDHENSFGYSPTTRHDYTADSPRVPPAGGFAHPAELLEKLHHAEKEQDAAKQRLRERESKLVNQIGKLERQITKSTEEKVTLQEDVENLKLELSSRPSTRDWKESQHRIRLLERQIEAAIEQLEEQDELERIANSGSSTRNPKLALRRHRQESRDSVRDRIERRAKALQKEGEDNHRLTDTQALIRRDRMNHYLGLNKFRSLSKETVVDTITEICRELELTNPERVLPTILKMKERLKQFKMLQRFAKETVSYVMTCRVQEELDLNSPLVGSLEKVLSVLKVWSKEANELNKLRRFRALVAGEVVKSITSTNELAGVQSDLALVEPAVSTIGKQGLDDEQIIREVRELVSMERTIMMRKEAFGAADKEIISHPEVMVNRVVKHFQHLFNVRSVEGMFPKLNELYVFSTEMTNFLKALRPLLGLSPSCSVNTVLAQIQDVVEKQYDVGSEDMHLKTRLRKPEQSSSGGRVPFSQEYFLSEEQGSIPEWS